MEEENELDAAKRWDLASKIWDLRMGRDGDWYNKYVLYPAILGLLQNVSGKRILDAGCATGCLSRLLAKNGAVVTGMDISEGLLNKARGYEIETPLGISYIQGDLSETVSYFGPSGFDYIVCNMVIQDVSNYEATLHSLAHVLRGDGKLIVSTSHPCFIASSTQLGWKIMVKPNKIISSGPGISHLESVGELKGIVHKMDNYFQRIQFPREWEPGIITISFRRTLEDYVKVMYDSGLAIIRILEPLPTEDGKNRSPYIARLLERIPHFIVFELAIRQKV